MQLCNMCIVYLYISTKHNLKLKITLTSSVTHRSLVFQQHLLSMLHCNIASTVKSATQFVKIPVYSSLINSIPK